MKAKITMFKPNGKFKYSGECEVDGSKPLFKIWEEIAAMDPTPGIVNKWKGPMLVEVPEHEHNHPHLIMPQIPETPDVVPQFEYDQTRKECYEDGWAACRKAILERY